MYQDIYEAIHKAYHIYSPQKPYETGIVMIHYILQMKDQK